MIKRWKIWAALAVGIVGLALLWTGSPLAASGHDLHEPAFPPSLESYHDGEVTSIGAILKGRIEQQPFNLVATLIFFLAIVHTFVAGKFTAVSHRWHHQHLERIKRGEADRDSVHHGAELFHFLGEVEAIFGIWAAVLAVAMAAYFDWAAVVNYIGHKVNFTEPAFVVVIMTLAATRPILRLSENMIKGIARLFGGSLTAQWLTVLTIGPILGSFITEPAAMTISALVLGRTFYSLNPSGRFKYATLGLLFVNISVGGTLTHFAAPPVLMVAAAWEWNTPYMTIHFGWKAVVGILIGNGLYFLAFRRELAELEGRAVLVRLKDEIQSRYLKRRDMDARFDRITTLVETETGVVRAFNEEIQKLAANVRERLEQELLPDLLKKGLDESLVREAFSQRFEEVRLREMRRLLPALLPTEQHSQFLDPSWDQRDDPVPIWITIVHVALMVWTVLTAHHIPLFVGGMLFFLGFAEVTRPFQNRVNLKPAMLVGFFLAGLVIHGGLQGWWIAPILGNLAEIPLMVAATILTAFNDNAAITYLSTLVPDMSDAAHYAVVAGAVTGGGLTVIANAPNPAGVSLLKKYFSNEVSPVGLLAGALIPTVILFVMFWLLPG